ncbi:MAG: MgtC/SapB family protein [Hyphomicrobiales bacterium]|nr:MgtC/SapB family protein [Hyphomicrobiales bacterium]
MDLEQLLSRTALALGIGLLIGLERGWRRREAQPGARAAGIRTFAISGLLGGIVGAIAQSVASGGGIVLAAGLVSFAAMMAMFSRAENRALGSLSATTAFAGVLTFCLGAYALVGDQRLAAAVAVAAAAVLALREELHGWVASVTWPELRSGLVLLAMTFVALPVVPAEPIGPFGGVNPREVWIVAIVLAGVSFIGYAAVKYFGASRGTLLAAAAGGLVSSTAVTLANARRAAAREGTPRLLAAGVAVATAVSLLRVMAIAGALQPRLLIPAGPALIAAAAVAIGLAALMIRHTPDAADEQMPTFRNPFELHAVLGFALFLGAIIVLGRVASEQFGAAGAIVSAVLVGLADIDSVTVSMSRLAFGPLSLENAAYAVLAAVASNNICKAVIGAVIGRGRFALAIAAVSAFCLIAGTTALVLTVMLVPA